MTQWPPSWGGELALRLLGWLLWSTMMLLQSPFLRIRMIRFYFRSTPAPIFPSITFPKKGTRCGKSSTLFLLPKSSVEVKVDSAQGMRVVLCLHLQQLRADQWAPWLCLQVLGWQVCATMSGSLRRWEGSKWRSWCLYSRHFTCWSTSLAHYSIFLSLILSVRQN